MSHQIPFPAPSLEELASAQHNVVTASQLRARASRRGRSPGTAASAALAAVAARVYLLQPGLPTPEQRLWRRCCTRRGAAWSSGAARR